MYHSKGWAVMWWCEWWVHIVKDISQQRMSSDVNNELIVKEARITAKDEQWWEWWAHSKGCITVKDEQWWEWWAHIVKNVSQ